MGVAAQRAKFLGFIIDTNTMRMYVPKDRMDKLEAAQQQLLEHGPPQQHRGALGAAEPRAVAQLAPARHTPIGCRSAADALWSAPVWGSSVVAFCSWPC